MTQGISIHRRTSTAGLSASLQSRRGRQLAFLAMALGASTVLAPDVASAQSTNDLLRGSTNRGVGNTPGLLVRPGAPTLPNGQLIEDEDTRDREGNTPATQQALDQVAPPNPFDDVDEEEEAAARETPPSRLGPTQAFPDARDDEEEADDPFGDPLPDPAEPLTEEELERERLARLRRVRAVGAIEPIQSGGEIEEEEDPYEAVGLEWGAFTLRPTLDIGLAATSRQGFRETTDTPVRVVSDNEDGVFGQFDFGLEAVSNWSRHSLSVDANAQFQEGLRGEAEAEPALDISATGVLEFSEQTTLTGDLSYSYQLEDASSAAAEINNVDAIETAGTPSQQTISGELTLSHDTGLLFGELSVGANRTVLGEVDLGNGSTIEQSDNDNTLYTLGLRGGFRASPVFRPFAEAEFGSRVNDSNADGANFARDSRSYTLRLGTELDFGDKLSGEVAVGYVSEEFHDTRLDTLGGISLAASIDWLPRRGTEVGLTLETTTQPSGTENVSGALAYAGDVTINQQIRRNLSATVTAGLQYEDFNTIEEDRLTTTAGIGFTYWMNRNLGVVGNYDFERVMSDDPSQEQTTNSVFLGLRLQR